MNTKKLVVFSCIFLLLLSSTVFAKEGVYISGSVGASILTDSDIEVPGLPTVEVEYDTGLVLGAAMGYDFGTARLEGEVGYRMHDIDKFSALGVSVDGEGDVNTISFLVNGFYDIENKSAFTPYVSGGVGIANVEIDDVSVLGISFSGSEDDTVFAYQLGVGVGYAINESVTLDCGYRYFATSDLEFEDDAEVDYGSHNISLGVRYTF